ncbi:glutamate carboxypeptidase 2-like [Amphiura filiformis]|uniref:glutamate carboxypeptidase 2-like n=2 Tax=Amphiura filiformis TaxID=82378 RepID=UPI003B21E993
MFQFNINPVVNTFQAFYAAEFGAKGIILYSDPADYVIDGEPVYPDGIYLPGTGTQRGTLYIGSGDPQTPGYPSTDTAYRHPEANLTTLPTIPVYPIGYDDASVFLKRMAGNEVIDSWKGNISGITYRYGPGFAEPDDKKRVAMKIFTHNEVATAWNVFGILKGKVEPDRYVIFGNHRDAWGFGAIDPSSGTAAMLEVSKAFGLVKSKHGWRPRRTIMFASWGAEEFGLIGSWEWNEEIAKILNERAVAYLNIDQIVDGRYVVNAESTPNLKKSIYAAAKKVKDPAPSGDRQTVYDTWKARCRDGTNPDGTPVVNTLGSGSDYGPFVQVNGISAMDFRYIADYNTSPQGSSYPTYHSVYDTFYLVDTYYDPGYIYYLAGAQVMAELARDLADSLILPLDASDYAAAVKGYFEQLRDGDIGQRMLQEGLSFAGMGSAVDNFTREAEDFHRRLDEELDLKNVLQVRTYNDQLQKLERAFIDPLGLPDRPLIRHVVLAPSSKDSYASEKFPGIVDAMFDIDNNPDPNKWELVKQQLAVATFIIQSAASTLMEVA